MILKFLNEYHTNRFTFKFLYLHFTFYLTHGALWSLFAITFKDPYPNGIPSGTG